MFSVILTTYNQRDLVEASVDSILAQEFSEPSEFIVVDDASTDGTADLLHERYADRVRLITKEERRGWVDSLKRGLDATEGDPVVIFDPHCTAPPGWLATIADAFTSDVRVLCGRCGHERTFMHKLAALTIHADLMSPEPREMRMFFDDNSAFRRAVLEDLIADTPCAADHGDAIGMVLMSATMRDKGIRPTYAPQCVAWHFAPNYRGFLDLWWNEGSECTIVTRRIDRRLKGGAFIYLGPLAPFFLAAARGLMDAFSILKNRRLAGVRWFEVPLFWAAMVIPHWVYLAGLFRWMIRHRHVKWVR